LASHSGEREIDIAHLNNWKMKTLQTFSLVVETLEAERRTNIFDEDILASLIFHSETKTPFSASIQDISSDII
jgi:hypothetical protein